MSPQTSYNFKLLTSNDQISENQKLQLEQIFKDGFEEKFIKTLNGDQQSISRAIQLLMEYKLIPLDEIICAIDTNTGDIAAMASLNNFKEPGVMTLMKFAFSLIKLAGIKTSIKVIKGFLIIDRENKKLDDKNYIAEIYLASTRKDLRGLGIGSQLLNEVLKYVDTKCSCKSKENCKCKTKILVFDENPAIRLYKRLGFKEVKSVETPDLVEIIGKNYAKLIQLERSLFS